MLRDKSAIGVFVSTFFAIGLTFTPLPEWLREAILVGVWSCFVLSCLWWLYCYVLEKRCEKKRRSVSGKVCSEGAIEVAFETPHIIDPILYVRAFRVKITNKTDKVIESVGVSLEEISNDRWESQPPYEIRSLRMPYSLPVTPVKYGNEKDIFDCDINPGASKYFDLVYLRVEGGASWHLGIAPYLPRGKPYSSWRSQTDVDIGLFGLEKRPTKLAVSVSARTFPKKPEAF